MLFETQGRGRRSKLWVSMKKKRVGCTTDYRKRRRRKEKKRKEEA
jgi:hypothetical protein